MMKLWTCCIAALVTTMAAPLFAAPLPAFPGAEGAGAFAKGGRGGAVLFVTNLEEYLNHGAAGMGIR